jgi:hypothetical protein
VITQHTKQVTEQKLPWWSLGYMLKLVLKKGPKEQVDQKAQACWVQHSDKLCHHCMHFVKLGSWCPTNVNYRKIA